MQEQFLKCITKHLKLMGLLFLGTLSFMATPSFAVNQKLSDNDVSIKVNSDDMVYDMDDNTVTFMGNVVVTRGEFVMKSAKMKIFMKDKEAPKESVITTPQNLPLTGAKQQTQELKNTNGKNNIERIEAYDGVTFDYGSQSGKSESAVYESQTGLLTMRGNPVVREGENFIQGNVIRYFMNERRSEVMGTEKNRVEAIFNNNN